MSLTEWVLGAFLQGEGRESERTEKTTTDRVDSLTKSLIKTLKKLRKQSGEETAIAAAAKVVEAMRTADLIEEKKKKAA